VEAATEERVAVAVEGHVAEVRLMRPDKHNGLDFPMFDAINAAIDRLRKERSVRAVVLCGEGRSFCAGLDFMSVMASDRSFEDSFDRRGGEIANDFQRVAYGWQQLPVPVIAALQGNVLGGGAQIALGADIRIAGRDLAFSIREIKWGLIPDMGITQSLPRLVGLDVAKELTFTGRTIDAEEALQLGLVTRLADEPLAAARELATELAGMSPDAMQRAKRLLEESWKAPAEQALALEERLQRQLLGTPNQLAAVQAGMAGEPARFTDPAEQSTDDSP
jgi:enoyl-CoA hydratase/carnithine racemase